MDRVVDRNAVALACAASAGVHAALAPEHLEESAVLGAGFAIAAVCLLAAAVAFAAKPVPAPIAAPLTAALLVALIAAYVVSRTAGLPVPGGEVEPIDGIGVATQAVQIAGLAGALRLIHHPQERKHSDEVPSGSHS
jgi:hypothetical protein